MGLLWPLFRIIACSSFISANLVESNFSKHIYKLTNEISENYFQVFRCITYAADDVRNADYLEKTLPRIVINLSVEGEGASNRDVIREAFEQGCGGVIVQTRKENRPAMVRTLIDAKSEAVSYRYNKERYLFLPVSDNDTDTNVLLDERMFFLPNFLFVSPHGCSKKLFISSHTVFDPGKSKPFEVLDTWLYPEGFERGTNLYWDKVGNVKGKKLVFGLMHYVPYSVIIQEGNRTIYDGVETRIAAQFVETINGTYDGLDHPKEMWGTKFPNGSGSGIYGSVQRHNADLGYSAIYQWYCDVLDCSYPYIQAEVICLVPKPKVLTSWITILLPFSVTTWIGLSVSYIISCCFVFGITLAAKRLKGIKVSDRLVSTAFQAAYNIFRLQMHQIPKFSDRNHPVATYVKISLFYYFSVSVFWQGGIASILTVPRYEKPIDSAGDLLSRWPSVKWGANHDVWIHSIENSTEPVLAEIVKKFVILDEETLIKKTKTRDFAFFMEKLPNNHFGFNDYINEGTVPYLQLMKYNIYTAFAVMILPRGSPFTEKLDHVVHWLFATGITQKMEIQVSLERINNHLQNMIRYSNDKRGGKAILTVGHIQGPLYIYFGGILISTMTLVGEKFIFFKKSKKKSEKQKGKAFSEKDCRWEDFPQDKMSQVGTASNESENNFGFPLQVSVELGDSVERMRS